jgi:Ca-activated chloride channel family protein
MGDGIARAVEFGTQVPSGEQVVAVMLSDGNDFKSEVTPEDAATRAAEADIRIDTIAMGDPDASVGHFEPANVGLLQNIAHGTGGRFYRAVSAQGLNDVYRNVRTRVTKITEIEEMAYAFVGGATVFALIAAALSMGWLRRVP